MVDQPRLQRWAEYFLSFGAFEGESNTQRGRRRIVVGYAWIGAVITVGPVIKDLSDNRPLVALCKALVVVAAVSGLVLIRAIPHLFSRITNMTLLAVFTLQLIVTALLGGLWLSGLTVLFGLVIAMAAAIALSPTAAAWWFVAFVASTIYAAVIPNWIEPTYIVDDPTADAVLNIVITALLTFAVLLYFARQRDRFQKQSDDLLHNILPDDIAERLKTDNTMIAEQIDQASVLFADVADFTPMSAGMAPTELVGLLNSLFSVFDGFVSELGVEKIKTAGDEYMVAAGVPTPRSDHARAAAELALRMRDHVSANLIEGQQIRMRIGIHSGPLVAGIIGTGKFSYDLWGDTVNTASRMESGGVVGAIQVTRATYELIKDDFVLTPRGSIPVKGKDDMEAFILNARV